jgi:hypothetical protein
MNNEEWELRPFSSLREGWSYMTGSLGTCHKSQRGSVPFGSFFCRVPEKKLSALQTGDSACRKERRNLTSLIVIF